eukprot:m.88883 g.88883  ORF g.88883 m.88883 type:complete len:56 (+) comp20024_c0_seq1:106-273(+)
MVEFIESWSTTPWSFNGPPLGANVGVFIHPHCIRTRHHSRQAHCSDPAILTAQPR